VRASDIDQRSQLFRFIQFELKMSGINKPDLDNGVRSEDFELFARRPLKDVLRDEAPLLLELEPVDFHGRGMTLTEDGLCLVRDVMRYLEHRSFCRSGAGETAGACVQ
jgi:hypothetical protein